MTEGNVIGVESQEGDMECIYCGKPLRVFYPDAPFELRFGHVSREDAYHCRPSRKPGVWPVPNRGD